MDGTIADLFGVEDWAEKIDSGDFSPYQDAEPLYNMDCLNEILYELIAQGWEIQVISWLALHGTKEFNNEIRKQKRAWLKKYSFPASKCHFVKYGTPKSSCLHKDISSAILIDDNEKVRKSWRLGMTINPQTEDLFECLTALLN